MKEPPKPSFAQAISKAAEEFEAAEKEVASETAQEISKMKQKEAQYNAMMAVFTADLPGEINKGFDKAAKEFSDNVVA